MRSILVNTNSPYKVNIGCNMLKNSAEFVQKGFDAGHVLIVSDENSVAHADSVSSAFEGAVRLVLPAGEAVKSFSSVQMIVDKLLSSGFPRNGTVFAVGGGAVSDVTGFACSIYMRGIPFISVPTTLLSCVDASVGGKNGIDYSGEKNILGTFWQPSAVIIDCGVIASLPHDIFADGMAEVIKYGVLFSRDFFIKVSSGISEESLEDVIAECCEYKAHIVEADERDYSLRHLLNFGHTVAHALEKASGFTLSHGRAVGIGMVITSRGAYLSGLTKKDISRDIARALKAQGLPVKTDILPYLVSKNLRLDKKSTSNGIDEIIPSDIGSCAVVHLTDDELSQLVMLGMGA